jgi:hypothetical protein
LLLLLVGNILKLLPYGDHMLSKLFWLMSQTDLPKEMFLSSLLSAKMVRTLWRMCYLNVKTKIKEGDSFPDAKLIDTTNRQR